MIFGVVGRLKAIGKLNDSRENIEISQNYVLGISKRLGNRNGRVNGDCETGRQSYLPASERMGELKRSFYSPDMSE